MFTLANNYSAEEVKRGEFPIECETENEGKNGKSRTESKLIEEIVCDVV